MGIESMKVRATRVIDENRDRLIELSRSIFEEPELKFEEYNTVRKLLRELKNVDGLYIEKGIGNLETAFKASLIGTKRKPTVAMLAEFDALPNIGHGCGHHLICTSTVGAMLGLASVIGELAGTVELIGTPGEEGGAGKIIMHERGVFDHLDAVYSIHPYTANMVGLKMLGIKRIRFRFIGKAAHASTDPHYGRSALEAVIQTFVNINGIRLYTKEDARIHGIIEDGGTVPNIIPETSSCLFYVRACDNNYLEELKLRVENCAKAAAISTETNLEIMPGEGRPYKPLKPNQTLTHLMRKILEDLGITDFEDIPYLPGSNDMGDLSHDVPAARAWLKICGKEVGLHTPDFASASMSEKGQEAIILAAKLQALVAIELLYNPGLLEEIKGEFHRSINQSLLSPSAESS